VKVHTHAKTGKVKFASAHDLRRSFGTRWARLVPTAVLMQLMRHESIQTTNADYVDLDADEIAEDLYRVSGQAGTVSGTVTPAMEDSSGGANDVTLYGKKV
jgi:integrase